MTETVSPLSTHKPAPQAVADSTGTMTIAVHCGAWETVAPGLPPGVADMVAPPITVSSTPVAGTAPTDDHRRAEHARYRSNMPSSPTYGRQRRTTRTG